METSILKNKFVKMWGPTREVHHTDIESALRELSPSLAEDWNYFQSKFNTAALAHDSWRYEHFNLIIDRYMLEPINKSFFNTQNPEFWKSWYKRLDLLVYIDKPTIKEVI